MLGALAMLAFLGSAIPSTARAAQPTLYPMMAPLSKYLMADRQGEIDFARSAVPKSVSRPVLRPA